MTAVGIIANPSSGKDIRRLVAHGSVFDNHEKANIVRRVLLGLDAVGVERAWIMPDSFGIGTYALDGVRFQSLQAALLDMPVTFTSLDSQRATSMLAAAGVGCIITLGGDGTNRLVARSSGSIPLMPISTGTNNVFPSMVEGTLAGLAAGLVACGRAAGAVERRPCLDIRGASAENDLALVDVAVYDERFVGARAVWEPDRIVELVLARMEAGSIGLSSIGAHLGLGSTGDGGLHVRIGGHGRQVMAPIAPGVLAWVTIEASRRLKDGDTVRIQRSEPYTLALDGEREFAVPGGAEVCIRFRIDGPPVVDLRRALSLASDAGHFLRREPG
jgi:hypothetical protein